jgi:hypothetical protein
VLLDQDGNYIDTPCSSSELTASDISSQYLDFNQLGPGFEEFPDQNIFYGCDEVT